MLKKILLLSAALLFVSAGTAAAQDAYPPPASQDSIEANDTTVAPGESMVLGIQVCAPGATASFVLDNSTALGSGTANSAGRAEATVTIPSNTQPGTHTITGSCPDPEGGTLTQVLSFTVTAPGQAGGALPTTGSDSTFPMTQVALAAIAGGGLLVLLANKRRQAGRADARETAGV
jgi:LPXTG-motif cell wall-anchored protein